MSVTVSQTVSGAMGSSLSTIVLLCSGCSALKSLQEIAKVYRMRKSLHGCLGSVAAYGEANKGLVTSTHLVHSSCPGRVSSMEAVNPSPANNT